MDGTIFLGDNQSVNFQIKCLKSKGQLLILYWSQNQHKKMLEKDAHIGVFSKCFH